jgi:hypothetical protein
MKYSTNVCGVQLYGGRSREWSPCHHALTSMSHAGCTLMEHMLARLHDEHQDVYIVLGPQQNITNTRYASLVITCASIECISIYVITHNEFDQFEMEHWHEKIAQGT